MTNETNKHLFYEFKDGDLINLSNVEEIYFFSPSEEIVFDYGNDNLIRRDGSKEDFIKLKEKLENLNLIIKI